MKIVISSSVNSTLKPYQNRNEPLQQLVSSNYLRVFELEKENLNN